MKIVKVKDQLYRLIREIPECSKKEQEFYKSIYCVDTVLKSNGKFFLADTISDVEASYTD
jgi:hypothetical protein